MWVNLIFLAMVNRKNNEVIAMKRLKNQKGSVLALLAILLPVLLGFTGLAVDFGRLYMEKGRLQNIADAAVLAGLAELKAQNKANGKLIPSVPEGATTTDEEEILEAANTGANEYLRKNSGDVFNLENVNDKKVLKTAIYRIKNSDDKYSYFYELIVGHELPLYFGQIIYPKDMLVQAEAVVQFDKIESLPGDDHPYSYYFNLWRDTPLNQLQAIDPAERIKADQKALELIARAFIGKDFNGVKELMRTFTRGEDLRKIEQFDPADGLNGYSEATLVPLAFELVRDESGSYYTWLKTEENKNLVSNVLASNADIVSKEQSGIARTKVEDGILYSDGIISDIGNTLRTVNLRLHYTNGIVDSVDITARQGNYSGNVLEGLNLNVTADGYTLNDKDYVKNPNLPRS